MIVIKSENDGISWIFMGSCTFFNLFMRTLHEWIVIGCERMLVKPAENPEIQTSMRFGRVGIILPA